MIRLLYVVLFLFFTTFNSNAHVSHYNKIKYLKYDIYLDNELIGYHYFKFERENKEIVISGDGSFKVSKFGINLINYKTNSLAIYRGNQLIKFESITTQNDKKKYANIEFKDGKLNINGSSFKGDTKNDSIMSSLWNHEIIKKNKQISSISGSINNYNVKFLGKKDIIVNNKKFKTLNFHIFSDDNKKMKDKKININIWYDNKSLVWIKASYRKLGLWEYRLNELKY